MTIPAWFYWEIGEGDHDPAVYVVQRKLGLPVTGTLDAATSAVLRGFQAKVGLEVTGTLSEGTARALGPESTEGLLPLWWGTPAQDQVIAERIGDSAAVRRFQSAHRITPTGVMDKETAVVIGD